MNAAAPSDPRVLEAMAAVARAPQDAGAWSRLAERLHETGERTRAAAAWEKALELAPDHGPAHLRLAGLHMEHERHDEAVLHLQAAFTASLHDPTALIEVGESLLVAGELDAAERCAEVAARLAPASAGAPVLAGLVALQRGEREHARRCMAAALALEPGRTDAETCLAGLDHDAHRLDEAIVRCERVLAREPGCDDARWVMALAQLMRGDHTAGFANYEVRARVRNGPALMRRSFGKPRWNGWPRPDGVLLVYCEQGYGDALLFARFLPAAAARVGRVIVECAAPMARLLASVAGVDSIVTRPSPWPAHDTHCALGSLPHLVGDFSRGVPATAPYLVPPPDDVGFFRDWLATRTGMRVGLCWRTGSAHHHAAQKNVPVAALAPLAAVAGIAWTSLQVDAPVDDARAVAAMLAVREPPSLADFAATAALVAGLDLVVTIDTAVAHLAGALGVPVWLLLRHGSEWQWGLGRSACDWYPSMRIFRQPSPGDWETVLAQVAAALASR